VHVTIEGRRAEISELCRQVGVRRLDVFGSAAGGGFDETTSDVDFVVDFAGETGFDYFDAYFSLKEGLEAILGRPVDLVTRSSIENPYFRESVEQSQELIYAA
jgi:predicted nucleotidyltransferase